MLNRTQQPALVPIDKIDFVAPNQHEIAPNIPLFHMKDVPNETARLDLYFDAGKCRGQREIPSFVSGLLLSGTANKTSIQINEEINSLGGFMESGISVENSVITIYSLRENLMRIAHVLMDAIQNTAFIQKEVDELISDRKQGWLIKQEKVNFLAQQNFQKQLFSNNDTYSSPITASDFENVQIEILKAFHEKYYKNGLQKVVVVGDLDAKAIDELIELTRPFTSSTSEDFATELISSPGHQKVEKDGALQTAIRVGRTMFNKKHEDYPDFLVLNTILGDYFGSRLMANIREDKGYTYGIGCMLAELNHTGYFLIATEVGKDVTQATLKEIQFELLQLQETLVPEEELELVKNYMLGQLLKSADGPYAMTDLFMSAQLQGESLEFYNKILDTVRSITSERIRELAQTYLRWEDMSITTAG